MQQAKISFDRYLSREFPCYTKALNIIYDIPKSQFAFLTITFTSQIYQIKSLHHFSPTTLGPLSLLH